MSLRGVDLLLRLFDQKELELVAQFAVYENF